VRILALDSSFDPCGLALVDEGGIVASMSFRHERDLSRWWAIRLRWLMSEIGWTVKDLDGFAVCHGPGSFTGLRIGVAVLKTMAQALQKPILGISSLELIVLPYRAAWPGTILSILPCRKGEVYRAAYAEGGTLLRDPAVRTLDELYAEIEVLPQPLLVTGDVGPKDAMNLPAEVRRGDSWLGLPNVEVLAREGHRRLSAGEGIDPFALNVLYLKRSQAEEQLEAHKRGEPLDPSSYLTVVKPSGDAG